MIEKRTMWYVNFDFPNYDEQSVTVYMDTETNKVLVYDYGDTESYIPDGQDRFYNTQDEAAQALAERRQDIRDMMPKVKKFIEMMEDISPSDKFDYKREDYLGFLAKYKHWSYEEEYRTAHAKYSRLLWVACNGVLNINANTFKVSEIVNIKWNRVKTIKDGKETSREAATVVLKDGSKIRTCNDLEYEILIDLFGDNKSNRIYTFKENEDD